MSDKICKQCSILEREGAVIGEDGLCDPCRKKKSEGGKVAIAAMRKSDLKRSGDKGHNPIPPPKGKKMKHKSGPHQSGWI